MTLRVVVALSDLAFEAAVVRRLARADSGATVVRRCLDVVELRAVVGAQLADVVVVDTELNGLDREVLAELHAQGVRVVATTEAPAGTVGLSYDAVVPPNEESVCSALRGGYVQAPVSTTNSLPGGRIVAVWGPVGSPGRTTVAVTLADELARLGVSILLADADTYGPSIAQQLGLLDDSSGLAAVCRLAASDRLDVGSLTRTAVAVSDRFRVLTGISRPDRWDEIRPASLDAVWQVCRETVSVTLVDVGFCLEHDDLAWFEPGTAARNQAAVATLAAADVLVAVGGADPVGLVRYLRDLPSALALAPTAAVECVVNRVPSGRGAADELVALLREHGAAPGPAGRTTLVPDDPAPLAASLRSGRTLAEGAPRSGARRAVKVLAERLAGVSPGRRRRRAA